jgi:hypothetical protein
MYFSFNFFNFYFYFYKRQEFIEMKEIKVHYLFGTITTKTKRYKHKTFFYLNIIILLF